MKQILKITLSSLLFLTFLVGCASQMPLATEEVIAIPSQPISTATTSIPTETPAPSPEPSSTSAPTKELRVAAVTACETPCWPIAVLDLDEIAYFSSQTREIKIASIQGVAHLSLALTPLSTVLGSPDGKWLAVSTLMDGGLSELRIGPKDSFDLNAAPIFTKPAKFKHIRWAADGQAIFIITEDANGKEVSKISLEGVVLESLGKLPAGAKDPILSPDSLQVAYISIGENTAGLYLFDLANGTNTLLHPGYFATPTWSLDGKKLAFVGDFSPSQHSSGVPPQTKIYIATLGESGLRILESPDKSYRNPLWSPDGLCLFFAANSYTADGA